MHIVYNYMWCFNSKMTNNQAAIVQANDDKDCLSIEKNI